MGARIYSSLKRIVHEFGQRSEGSFAPTFALALIPVLAMVGSAVDYSRANATKATLQSALDAALLAGAKDGSSNWTKVAQGAFDAKLSVNNMTVPHLDLSFDNPTSSYTGSTKTSVSTSMLGIINVRSVEVGARGTAKMMEADDSCILTLDHGQSRLHVSLSLNGAPIVNLSGCSIRSNTSIDCNGNDGGTPKAIASGSAAGCGRPKPNSPAVPDTFEALASNIVTKCGSARPGVSWSPGAIPTGAGIIKETTANYVAYHICGDLQVSGTGYLTGSAPTSDVLIVIENGSLIIDDKASISAVRTTIILTGNNSYSAKIEFPNGAGKQASLSLSPSVTATNPWQGVALYLDPKLTKDVNNTWGPGAEFNADGLVYLGTSNVVTDGNTASNNSRCTKFVMNQFTTNGRVNLNFAQQNCAVIGLKQWGGVAVHLIR